MKNKLTKELMAEAWARGLPAVDILKAMRISRRTLCRWRKELGLPQRQPFGHQKKEKINGN